MKEMDWGTIILLIVTSMSVTVVIILDGNWAYQLMILVMFLMFIGFMWASDIEE